MPKITLIAWYEDVKRKVGPTIIMKLVMQFGHTFASAVIELGNAKFCRGETMDEFVRFIMEISRFADNLAASHWDKHKLEAAVEQLKVILPKF